MSRCFRFNFAHAGRDCTTLSDRFALPGRTIQIDSGRVQIDFASDTATLDHARADAERYRGALELGGLSFVGMRAEGDPDPMGWANSLTVTSASPEVRGLISRAIRFAREKLLESPADDVLRQAYDYLQEAEDAVRDASRRTVEPPSSIFVSLYKCIETIDNKFGRAGAGAPLGVGRELKAVGRICNEGRRDTRHAPRAGEIRSPVSWDELNSALADVQVIILAYERSLGLSS